MRIGYFLACAEYGSEDLLWQARMAEESGFEALWISDHYHPWNREQGESPFVWGVIGGLSQATSLPVTTGVTCPTVRIHPAIIAQAAATSAVMLGGRFSLGVGSGENLNEHILGDRWPPADIRLEMLEESIGVMRLLWEGGVKDHYGKHYTVENARLWTLPEEPPEVLISGFGPRAAELAGKIGDGYGGVDPDAELISIFRTSGGGDESLLGRGRIEGAQERPQAVGQRAVAGELAQELPTTAHVEQAISMVTEEMIAEAFACGPDPERHREMIRQRVEAGYDEVYVHQIGGNHKGFFELYEREILPEFR